VIAKGVGPELQLEFLRQHGCHGVQGFLLGKPTTAERFSRLLPATNGKRSAGCASERVAMDGPA
jgi:EAL domain-containing protein (putative c-di-GMP-specific phosphodiesterase class I)